GADLVIGMAAEHVSAAAVAAPDSWSRIFGLKDLVRRGEAAGARRDGESMAKWLERVGAGRHRGDLLEASTDDDVADPIGLTDADYENMAVELDDLVGRLTTLAFPEVVRCG